MTAVLPVAAYAAEHEEWTSSELKGLRSAALQAARVAPPGVPHDFMAVAPEPKEDAAFSLPAAALNRLAREIWLATGPEESRHADALTGEELYRLHRTVMNGAAEVLRGPGRAIRTARKQLGLEWKAPHIFKFGEEESDLTSVAPGLF